MERKQDIHFRSLFRQAVESAVEVILTDNLRKRLADVQTRVLTILESNGEKLVEAFIDCAVGRFFQGVAIDDLRTEISALTQQVVQLEQSNGNMNEQLRKEMIDELTGVYRKKYFLSAFKRTLMLLRRESFNKPVPVTVVFFDLDHFKTVNDMHGHPAGDAVLSAVGAKIKELFKRDTDISGRYGGEEFILVLPDCNETNAIALAEKLRSEIERMRIPVQQNGSSKILKVTISLGVFTGILHKLNDSSIIDTMNFMIGQADQLLYKSKHRGRNAVHSISMNMGEMPDEDGAMV